MCAILIAGSHIVQATESPGLRFGVHPYLSSAALKNRFQPLLDYLSKSLKTPITLHISKDYESHIALTGSNSFDIAYLGPASYVVVAKRYGQRPVLGRLEVKGKPYFHGHIIVRQNSTYHHLGELKGKRFAFTSSRSTMGYRVPRYMLAKAGLKLEHLGLQKFLGNHDNVALGVLVGDFDAGAVKEEVYDKFKKQGIRSLAKSAPVSEHLFVNKPGMPEQLSKKIQTLLYKLASTPDGLKILHGIKKTATGIVPGNHNNYINLQQMLD